MALTDGTQTITDQLREAAYCLAELAAGAPDAAKLEAITGTLAIAGVVIARQAEQVDALMDVVGQLAQVVEAVAPIAEQLAGGGPAALLGLLGRTRG